MTKKEIKQALYQTLEQMPNFFTSRMFCVAARKHGITDYHVKSQVTNSFLKKECTNDSTYKRSWHKGKSSVSQHSVNVASQSPNAVTLDEAIAIVKASGLIVCKKQVNFVEI